MPFQFEVFRVDDKDSIRQGLDPALDNVLEKKFIK